MKRKKNDDTFVVIKLRFFSAEPEKASRETKKNGQGESEKSNRADRSSVSSQPRRASSKLTMTRGIRVRPRLTFFLLDPLISLVCSNETVQHGWGGGEGGPSPLDKKIAHYIFLCYVS